MRPAYQTAPGARQAATAPRATHADAVDQHPCCEDLIRRAVTALACKRDFPLGVKQEERLFAERADRLAALAPADREAADVLGRILAAPEGTRYRVDLPAAPVVRSAGHNSEVRTPVQLTISASEAGGSTLRTLKPSVTPGSAGNTVPTPTLTAFCPSSATTARVKPTVPASMRSPSDRG